MDHAEEIKKLIAKFREYQDSPEYVTSPMSEVLDLIEKIEKLVDKELTDHRPPWHPERG